MAAKRILLVLDSDRHASPLIGFLTTNGKLFDWKLKVGCMSGPGTVDNLKTDLAAGATEFALFAKIQECEQAIRKSDLVIALVAGTLLLQIADSCIAHRKTLISPARLTRQMALKKSQAKDSSALILMDCGFSPGLDHIIAKKAIDNIHAKGGTVRSFKTYSGVLLSEAPEHNPWMFKLTEPVNELLAWGKYTNRHLLNGKMQHVPGHRLFERAEPIVIRDKEHLVAIPEGDSLYYKKIYDLTDAHTVMKAKLVRKGFERVWNALARLGLTDTHSRMEIAPGTSLYSVIDSLLPADLQGTIEDRLRQHTGADESDIEKLH